LNIPSFAKRRQWFDERKRVIALRPVGLTALCVFALFLSALAQTPKQPPQSSSRTTAVPSRTPLPAGATTVSVETHHQLFATLCALQAAGFEKEVSDAGFHPLRRTLRNQLLRGQGPATEALTKYVAEHRLPDPAATLSRYVSLALVVGPPPKFAYTFRRDELPPDVAPIENFNELLASFYVEARIDRLWAQVQGEYEGEMDRLGPTVRQIVGTASGYLRELLTPTNPRRFIVVVEPLIGARTSFRSYGTNYFVVVSPRAAPPVDDIQHAFLHFLLDPLPGRYPNTVQAKRPLLDIAARAPRLPTTYSSSLSAWVVECLVRAIELKLRKPTAEQLSAILAEADSDGFVLVRPFYRELEAFQQAEPAMSFYFPDFLRGVRTSQELKRLEGVQFTSKAPAVSDTAEAIDAPVGPSANLNTELAAWLAEGDRAIASQDAAGAVVVFERVLATYPGQPRAVYGRAVAALLQNDVERARELLGKLVRSAPDAATERPDPLVLAWAHVHLGRIHDVEGDRELALSEYRAALAVEGAPEAARLAARRGLEKGFQSSQQGGPQRP